MCGVIDFVDGIDHIDNVLYGNRLVGAKYDGGIALPVDFGADDSTKFFIGDGCFIHVVLKQVVDIYGNGLLGHGLAAA